MSGGEQPSQRLVEQRLRNRAMEALEALREGNEGVRAVGWVEYVEEFFDVINDRAPWHWQEWSCFTPDEVGAINTVQQLLRDACQRHRNSARMKSSSAPGGQPESSPPRPKRST